VNGNTFVNAAAALQRSCSIQNNACSDAANAGTIAATVAECGTQETACNAATAAAKRSLPVPSVEKRAALDFGTCSDPAIIFGGPFDGRTEESFEPANLSDFNHGSADGIAIIASFICGQLSTSCKASADAVSACTSAETAASSATGQAAADAFNSALGVSASAASGTSSSASSASTTAAATATADASTSCA
jgi:hypothetical protein